MTPRIELTPKQEKAIPALLSCRTIQEAAQCCGTSEATLLRWLKLPAFVDEYRRARREVVEQAIALLQSHTADAVETIASVMSDQSVRAGTRIKAAETILTQALRAVELLDMEQRIVELEARIEGNQ